MTDKPWDEQTIDALAASLYFDEIDGLGWPNGMPTWSEIKASKEYDLAMVVSRHRSAAVVALEFCARVLKAKDRDSGGITPRSTRFSEGDE